MEDLVTFFIFLIVVGVSLVNSIAQAKKRREEELEEALRGEDGEERQEVYTPAPRTEPRSTSPPAKGTGWDELRKQLEQMLGDGEVSHETKPIAPAPKEQPRTEPAPLQKTEPVSHPVSTRPASSHPRGRTRPAPPKRAPVQPLPTQPETAYAAAQRLWRKPPVPQKPVPVRQQPARIQPQPARAPQRLAAAMPKRVRRKRRGFPNLHPDPLANAIVLSEILRPYSRKPGPGRRPPYGAG